MRKLMPQQIKALKYASPLARIALFMEMRLGKTTVAIRWAEENKLKRILVLCPDDVKSSWEKELRLELTADEDIINLDYVGEENRICYAQYPAQWFLITYQSVLYGPGVLDLQWDGIILDESTYIRNPKADITKLLLKKRDNFKYRAILSGYPAPESMLDYFTQLNFIDDYFMQCSDYWRFRQRYFCPGGYGGYTWACSKFTEAKIKDEVEQIAFVMTRAEAGIGSKKLYTTLEVSLNKAQKDILKQIEEGFAIDAVNKDDYGEDTKWIPVKYQWESQIAGGFSPHNILLSSAKLNLLLKLLKGELKNEKIVIWFRYTAELEYVTAELNKANYYAVPFYGKDKSGAEKFTSGKAQLICAQAKCGRYGLDWSISDTAIYYSNWYDGEIREQSEDRIIHPLKKKPVLYIDLVTKETIDTDVVVILKKKKLTARQFLEELAKRRNKK